MGSAYCLLQALPRGTGLDDGILGESDAMQPIVPGSYPGLDHFAASVAEALSNMEVVQKGCLALFLAALVGAQTELAPNALCSPQDLSAWANLEAQNI